MAAVMNHTPQSSRRLLVSGATGYLGRRLTRIAASQHQVVSAYNHNADRVTAGQPIHLNITDSDHVKTILNDVRPDAVIHCAAANPGVNANDMKRINIDGTRHIAMQCATLGIRLVHVSTDMVHDGEYPPYDDDAAPTATQEAGNLYGESKAQAEAAVIDAAPDAAIVRTSLIYGLHDMDRGTGGFVQRIEAGDALMLFSDVIRQPVFADSLIHALVKLATQVTDFSGRLNVAGSQAIDRASFAMRMLDWWGIDYAGRLTTGPASELENPPPLDLRLQLDRARDVLSMQFPGVDEIVEYDR